MTDYPTHPSQPGDATGPGGYGAPARGPYGPQPASVATAVKLVWAQIVLSVVSSVVTFALLDTLVDQALEDAGTSTTITEDTVRNGAIVGAVVGIVIGVVLWGLLGYFLDKGRNWARIVLTVLGVLGIVFGLLGLLSSQPVLLSMLSVVSMTLTAAMVFFLWKPESSAWLTGKA